MRTNPKLGYTDAEALSYNTVRLELENVDGDIGYGTGFLYQFQSSNNTDVPVIVTNRHVFENVKKIDLYFNPAGKDNKIDFNGIKIGVCIIEAQKNCWYAHPNSDIDLAILPVAKIVAQLHSEGKIPYMLYFTRSTFPKEEEWITLTALEQVVVVGYPAGIWDSTNNLPVLRRGVTATHPKIDFHGRPEFLVDVAVYPGSSGSPIFLYEHKDLMLGQELNLGKDKPRLAGILSEIYAYRQSGEMKSVPIPTVKKNIPITEIPNNLGVAVKSTELDGFIPLIDKLLEEQKSISQNKDR